jgi:(p)ppGpp synthase/HD superfamily hydrolase
MVHMPAQPTPTLSGRKMYLAAVKIAKRAHQGQRREAPDNRPYFKHVEDVANFFADWDTKTVAILHDAIEDTAKFKREDLPRKVTERSLRAAGFPEHVIAGVVAMTKPPGKNNYQRYLRKQVLPNLLARRVKAADNYVNLRDAIASWTYDADALYRVNKYVDALHLLKRGYRIR